MRKNYNSYHSTFKKAASLGILPKEIEAKIPKSTRSRFKNTDYSKLFGIEYAADLTEHIHTIKTFIQDQKAIKVYQAVIRIKNTIIKTINLFKTSEPKLIHIKEKIINTINRTRNIIGFKRALKYFNLSTSKFYLWMNEVKYKCTSSILKKCLRFHPQQLTGKETNKMKSLCSDGQFKGWPVSSIAFYALKHRLLTASLSTWYKYTRILGLRNPAPKNRRKKRKKGIRADAPNKIWHADVTIFKTLDNQKAYIYLLIDNYSRYILNWKVSTKLSAKTCFHSIKEAYYKYIDPETQDSVDLITDAGPENDNHLIESFSKNTTIRQLTALKDIHFSNSMVESMNSLLKYRSLYLHDIADIQALKKHLGNFIPEYNEVRPHYAHFYLTPKEVFEGAIVDKDKFKNQFEKAKRRRIMENTKTSCPVCADTDVRIDSN